MTSSTKKKLSLYPDPLVVDVKFSKDSFVVHLADGREVSIPLEWSPRLRSATSRQRKNWRLIGGVIGIHWADVYEDLSVEGLLRVLFPPSQTGRALPKAIQPDLSVFLFLFPALQHLPISH